MSATISFDFPASRRRPGVLAGLAVSLLLHAVLLSGYRLSSPPEAAPAGRSMTVWLQPARPPAPSVAGPASPPAAVKPLPRKRAPVAAAVAGVPAAVQAIQPPPPAEAQAAPLPREQDPLYAGQEPGRFDIDAAKKAARKVASEKDPAKAGTLTAQLEEHPLYPEQSASELARKIDGATRPSCLKTGGGLLAPLVWLMDKKDSGCKF